MHDDTVWPALTALSQPYTDGLQQPTSKPTTMFGGDIPAVQFAPLPPVQLGVVTPSHGPEFDPIYRNGHAHPVKGHSVKRHALDVRG